MIVCPKCGFEQEQSPECAKCGIIMAKWQKTAEQSIVAKAKSPFRKWARTIRDETVHLIFVLFIVWLLYTGLLHMCRALWYLYVETPLGHGFVSYFPSTSHRIYELLDMNLFLLSVDVIVVASVTSLVTGAACQILSITRRFFLPMGLVGQIFFWGSLCSAFTSGIVRISYDTEWLTSFLMGLAPTLGIFRSCFELTSELLPELGRILDIKTLKRLFQS